MVMQLPRCLCLSTLNASVLGIVAQQVLDGLWCFSWLNAIMNSDTMNISCFTCFKWLGALCIGTESFLMSWHGFLMPSNNVISEDVGLPDGKLDSFLLGTRCHRRHGMHLLAYKISRALQPTAMKRFMVERFIIIMLPIKP
jgi:hypothetical protein